MIKNISFNHEFGWKKNETNQHLIWFKGFITNNNFDEIAIEISQITNNERISNFINSIDGQFAILILNKISSKIIVICDKILSIPIYYYKIQNKIIFMNYPYKDLKQSLEFENKNKTLLQLSMSGYCIDKYTIIKNLYKIEAGQYAILDNNSFKKNNYFIFKPWNKIKKNKELLINDLNQSLINSIKKLIKIANNRTIVIPLSDGLDSRFIISALKFLNYKNVICFSYGKKNSSVSETAYKISKKLGFKYFKINVSYKDKKKYFKSKEFLKFIEKSNNFSSITPLQDVYEINFIKKNKLIPTDSIIVNGQSGDFITGLHIPKKLISENNKYNVDEILNLYIAKHYSLWDSKKNYKNIDEIKTILKLFLNKYYIKDKNLYKYNSSIYEFLEFYGRQTRFIINQNIVYDYFGYDWYMPLWDSEIINFFEKLEDSHKYLQNMYKELLLKKNYGNVWNSIPINIKKYPFYIMIIRNFFKMFFLFRIRSWKKFDLKFFKYWLDDTCNFSIVDYQNVVSDRNGFRNYLSWVQKIYFKQVIND